MNDDDNNNNFLRTAARRCISVTFNKMTTKFKILCSSLRSFAVWVEVGDRGHSRHGPKRGGVAVPLLGELGPR